MRAKSALDDQTVTKLRADGSSLPAELTRELRHLLLGLQLCGISDLIRRPVIRTAADAGKPSPGPVVPIHESAPVAGDNEAELQQIRGELGDCKRCRLHQARRNLVFGDGSAAASVVFVGEGPGEDEDRLGRPFVGKAGRLLDQMIRAMGLERNAVYICNVVKCRPPGNRNPQADEIEICSPFLFRQLEVIRPKVICALGGCAAQTLTQKHAPVGRLRAGMHFWRGIPLVVTYHPAYLLRSPAQKAAAWQDLQEVLKLLD